MSSPSLRRSWDSETVDVVTLAAEAGGKGLGVLWILLCAAPLWAAQPVFPGTEWQQTTASRAGLDPALLKEARDYALTGAGSGYVTRHGQLLMSWGDPRQTYDLKSSTKSIGVTALGLASVMARCSCQTRR